jgi:hypothetical protein
LAASALPDTILTGNPKPQFSVRSLSLGQVGCSRVLGHYSFTIFRDNLFDSICELIIDIASVERICLGIDIRAILPIINE